jgi:hypothetical protein
MPYRASPWPLLAFVASACAASAPETPAPSVAISALPKPAADAAAPELSTAPPSPSSEAGASDGCAEESETVPVVIATQHGHGKKGFKVKLQAGPLKVDETLIDTATMKGAYTCCVHTEVESVRYECEFPDGAPSNGRVHREKDELVIDPGEGHDTKRIPIPCGSWLRFRGPDKDCESSPG